MEEKIEKECLNRAIGRKDFVKSLLRKLQKELEEAEESIRIWSKK